MQSEQIRNLKGRRREEEGKKKGYDVSAEILMKNGRRTGSVKQKVKLVKYS